ncbi:MULTISPECIES: hypothetical protein [Streptomyces]|uniref:DUF6907 domain-containing protein n=1 Tax=Streptomyces TaxID=1883 RepID=UPI002052B8DA|nr:MULTISPECIES: hypothetical protein [Streptomyces]UPT41805.1 hypothetical protein MWG59_10395 [Streptomyces sp. WAC00303]WIY76038.1 hypothetical protein QPM16_10255 [Streptomyces anulatus]
MSILQSSDDSRQATPGQAEPATGPQTWTFTNRNTDQPMTVTCMTGCSLDHRGDIATPTFASDIWCQTDRSDVTLPINESGKVEEYRVLGITLNVRPWDEKLSQRLPHASVEVIDDCWIEDLDPDALALVIATLESRLDVLRDSHTQLVKLRAEYEARP